MLIVITAQSRHRHGTVAAHPHRLYSRRDAKCPSAFAGARHGHMVSVKLSGVLIAPLPLLAPWRTRETR
eukprot:1055773-Pyramimonas_sp.AAC.1